MSVSINKQFQLHSVGPPQMVSAIRNFIPPLLHDDHKGTMGRIFVVGGSADYTGAPYYAADAALKFGGDLSTVFCSSLASMPIKGYSPELMVTSFYDDSHISYFSTETINNGPTAGQLDREYEINKAAEVVSSQLPRCHSMVVGPGLGRNSFVADVALEIITRARKHNINIVIDADGLWALQRNISVIHGYTRCVITPNAAELSRLVESVTALLRNKLTATTTTSQCAESDQTLSDYYESLLNEMLSADIAVQTRAMSLALGGVTVLRKGERDVISSGDSVWMGTSIGSARRCGGLGDLLSGCLAVAMHWQDKLSQSQESTTDLTLPVSTEVKDTRVDITQTSSMESDVDIGHRLFMRKVLTSPSLTNRQQRSDSTDVLLSPAVQVLQTSAGRQRSHNECASLIASAVLRDAAQLAFAHKHRATTALDVLNYIGESVYRFELRSINDTINSSTNNNDKV